MTGVDIIGALLMADPALLAVVPAARIKAAQLPDGIDLPALLVRSTSSVERQTLQRETMTRTTDRVSVTVRASSYRDQVSIMRRVRNCCAGKVGSIGGAQGVSVLTAGTGPDLLGPANSFEQTQDFRVGYNAVSTASGSVTVPALPGGASADGSSTIVMGGGAQAIDGLDWAP